MVAGLPSPYYHFQHDDSSYIIKAGFSSGSRTYDINYAFGRISEMKSTHPINKDRLIYQYENGKVFLVKYINAAGLYKRCFLNYNTRGELITMNGK